MEEAAIRNKVRRQFWVDRHWNSSFLHSEEVYVLGNSEGRGHKSDVLTLVSPSMPSPDGVSALSSAMEVSRPGSQ